MRTGLMILDRRGAVALFNTAAEQILGYRASEVRGKPAEEILDGLTDLLAAASCRRPDNGPEMQLKKNARHKDGRIIPLAVTPYLTPGNGGKGTGNDGSPARNGATLVFQDARQLEKMDNQLQHLDRLHSLDEFAAGILHEIRNPLAGISINAQYIVEEIGKRCQGSCTKIGQPDQFHEEMQDILADVESIESIVKRVLDFAHPTRSEVRVCPVDDVVKEALRFSEVPLRHQGIRLVASFCDSLNTAARVKVDVSQMMQVLFNIVRNACDAMPEGGELRVCTAGLPENGHVRVQVEDTGRGIPEEYLDRIFDPFFSMHARGTGLGLAISRKIVESHGGRIEVESRPGKGTKFAILLPAV